MRFLLGVLLFAFALFAGAPVAEARRSSFGPEDMFHTVAPLNATPETVQKQNLPPEWLGQAELARHGRIYWVILGANFEDRGYAVRLLGGDQYWPVTAKDIADLQRSGVLPANLPEAEWPLFNYVLGYSLWIGLGAIGLFSGVSYLLTRRNAKATADVVGDDFPAFIREVLINAARLDGDFSEGEYRYIAELLSRFGDKVVSVEDVRAADLASNLTESQLRAYLKTRARKLDQVQKDLLIRALVVLIAVDGQWDPKEKKALIGYLEALGVDKKQAPSVVEGMMAAR